MAIRIQLRRDLAANWISANPVLRAGEIGIETDTLKFKIGTGATWNSTSGYANVTPSSLTNSLNQYILSADQGNPGGPAELDSNGDLIIPENSIILWNDVDYDYTTTLTATQPTADRTLTIPDRSGTVITTGDTGTVTNTMLAGSIANNKLANSSVTINGYEIALGASASYGTDNINEGTTNLYFTNERAQDAVATALSNGTHTNISVSYNDNANAISLTGAVTYTDENAQDAIGNALGTGLSYNDSTGAISVDTTTIQARVTNVSDTEIGYLDGVTSAIQTQIDGKQAVVSGVSSTEIGYLDGVTSAIQTQLDGKQAIVSGVSSTEIGYLDGVTSAIQTQIDSKLASSTAASTYAPINNPTFTGTVTLPGNPGTANEAATKSYVDNISAGLNFHAAVHVATTTNISATYNNSAKTLSASGAFPQIDGQTVNETERVLVKSQTDAKENGIYTLTDDGDPSGTWVLTRAADADNTPAGEIAYGDFTFVQTGNTNGGFGYIMTTTGTITLGTSNINYTQFNTGQSVIAGNGLSEPTAGTLAINTAITADLSTAQTLTNKTLTSPTITGTGAIAGTFTGNLTGDVTGNVSGNAGTVTNGVYTTGSYSNPSWITSLGWSKISSTPTTISGYGITDGVSTGGMYSNPSWIIGLAWSKISSTPTTLSGYGILDGLTATTAASTYAPINNPTFTGTVGGITKSMVGLGNVENTALSTWAGSTNLTTLGTIATGTWSGTTIATTKGGTGLTGYTSGDILYASATDTLAKLAKGTDGQILTLASGVPSWAAAPITLPSQSGNSGKYLTTDGTTASWGTLVVPITTATATVSANTATTVDTTALSGFTSVEYMVSLKQGSKVRTSKVVLQTDGTSVDMTEFAITETGGSMTGVVVSATTVSTNAVLQVTVTDASSTNVTVKLSKVAL